MTHHQFIVTGVCTAGKSTFAHELVKKYLVQHICIDPIIEAFEDVFPELGITHKAPTPKEHDQVCQQFKPFVFRMIDGLVADDFVIEGFRLPLRDLYARYPHLQYFVFGLPTATPKEMVARCRKFDTNSWTNEMSDEELSKVFEFLIEESKKLQTLCQELGVPFFDTSKGYWGNIKAALEVTR
ncbi:MAG: hypothetical protein WC924_02290 [Candidatus Gracilibacteria bacterium]